MSEPETEEDTEQKASPDDDRTEILPRIPEEYLAPEAQMPEEAVIVGPSELPAEEPVYYETEVQEPEEAEVAGRDLPEPQDAVYTGRDHEPEPESYEEPVPEDEDVEYLMPDDGEGEYIPDDIDADDASMASYMKEVGGRSRSWLSANRRFVVFALMCAALCAVIVLAAAKIAGKKRPAVSADAVSLNVAETATPTEGGIPIPPDPLKAETEGDVVNLVKQYFEARQADDIESYKSLRSYTDALEIAKTAAKSEYIESYDDICCYTKPGPYEDSYMVYVSYNLKLKDWDRSVPALETLVLCRDQNGALYVYSGAFDESVVDYVRGVTSQEDVVELFRRVDTEYHEILDSDPEFNEYMSTLTQLIKDGVGVRLAAAAEEEAQAKRDAENGLSENAVEFTVEATDHVNVRSSDSENADRLGKVEPGTRLTCLGQLNNGWSKVVYEGKNGYIKSDYLKVVNATDEGGAGVTVQGKVTVSQTANIRATADVNGEKLGTAFAGTQYDLVEKGPEWTKILYNGTTAYIKSDYIE